MYDCLFTWIGKFFALYCGLKLLYNVYMLLRIYIFPTYPDFSKYGKWSVVTGATSGIGEAIAFELASRGQNIILISRSKEKLEDVSKNIAARHGVLTKYLQIDFTQDESIYEKIELFLKDYDIGVLVNNVGMASPAGYFTKTPNLSKFITNLTRVNMLSAVKMSQIVLPGMEERARGCIINISSASALHVLPGMALYAATKAFLKHFSTILSYECEDKGVTVQCCFPFFVKTNMTKNFSRWETMPQPENYVSSLLASLGKKRVTVGSIGFEFQDLCYRLVPTQLKKRIMNRRISLLNRKRREQKLQD